MYNILYNNNLKVPSSRVREQRIHKCCWLKELNTKQTSTNTTTTTWTTDNHLFLVPGEIVNDQERETEPSQIMSNIRCRSGSRLDREPESFECDSDLLFDSSPFPSLDHASLK